MANDRNLHVNLSVKADTSEAKAAFQDLQNTLSKLGTMQNVHLGQNISKEILEASNAALSLQQQLKAATNVNTGKLDLSVLKKNLENSGQSLASYREQLVKLGPDGEQAFMKVASSIASAELPLKKTNTALTEFLGTLKNTARWQISSSILHGFMGSLQSAYGYAQDLNRSLNDIQIVTQHSTEYMAEFADKANKAAKELSTTTTAYTNASLIFYQQGLSDEEVQKRTDVTIKMANASRQSAEEVSSQLTAIWNNFADGSKSLEYYADVLTKLGATTASSSSEISEGLQKFASIGETVGLSYEYAASALATITATSRESADTVGNALKTLFARIQSLKLGDTLEDGVDLNKYAAAIEKVGVHVLDTNGELRDMDAILDDLMERWDNLDRTAQTALAQTVAGQRQYAQFMTLMNNSDFFRQNVETAKGSEGSLQEQADIYAQSWEAAQKRVKAAAQAIYQDLLDDKFFITILNGFEKILTGIDGFIDSIGGLKTLVPAVGTLFLTLFKDQIGKGLEDAIHNITMLSDQGKQAYQEMQKAAVREIYNMADGSDSAYMQQMAQGYQRIGSLYETLIEEAEKMSEQEKIQAQELIKRQEVYEELVKKSGQELDNARELARQQSMSAYNSSAVNAQEYGKSFNVLQLYAEEYAEAMGKVNAAQNVFATSANMSEKELIEFEQAMNNANMDITVFMKDLEAGGSKAQVALEDIARILGYELVDAQRKFSEQTGVSAEKTEELTQSLIREADAERQNTDATNNAANAHEQAAESMKRHTDAAQNNSQAFVSTLSGITSIVSGINSLSRAYDTLTDKEKSLGEKILPTITGSLMGISMLTNGIVNLQKYGSKAIGFLATNIPKIGSIITGGFTKILTAGTGLLAAIGPTGWIILGITAGIVAIGVAWDAIQGKVESKIDKLQKEYKKMSEVAKGAQASAEKLEEKYQTTSTLISSYSEARKALDSCTTGTNEWYEALHEVNNSLSDILKQAPELAQFIDSEGNLDLKAAKEYQQQVDADAMKATFAANLAQLQLDQIEVEIDQEKLAKDVANGFRKGISVFEDENRIIQYQGANGLNSWLGNDYVGKSSIVPDSAFALNETVINKIIKDIQDGIITTEDQIRDTLIESIKKQYNFVTDDSGKISQYIYDEVSGKYEESFEDLDKVIGDIVDANFSVEMKNFSNELNKSAVSQKAVDDELRAMSSAAVNYLFTQDKQIKAMSEEIGISEDLVKAYMTHDLPRRIQDYANDLDDIEGIFKQYTDFLDLDFSYKNYDKKKEKINYTYVDEDGKTQKDDISLEQVRQLVASIDVLSGEYKDIFDSVFNSLKNINTNAPEFAQWLSDIDKGLLDFKGADIEKIKNSYIDNASNLEKLFEDAGVVFEDFGVSSVGELTEKFQEEYKLYQEELGKIINSVPETIDNQINSIKSNFTIDELKNISDILLKAMAESGVETEEKLFELIGKKGIKDFAGIAEELNEINWKTMSVDDFVKQMEELEYITPEAADSLKEVLNNLEGIAEVDIYQAIDNYKAAQDAISAAESGKNLTEKQFLALDPESQSYFTLVADGTYALIKPLEDFKESVNTYADNVFTKSMENAQDENELLNTIFKNVTTNPDYYSNLTYKNEKGKNEYNKDQTLEGIKLLELSGFEDLEKLEEWRSIIKDTKDSLSASQIQEIQDALVSCAKDGFEFLKDKITESEEALETNKNVTISSAKTYKDFQDLVKESGNNISKEDQDLWERIGFDPTTLKDSTQLLSQIKHGHLETAEAIKKGWDQVKGSTDVLSKTSFNILKDNMGTTADKMDFVEESAKKVKWSFEDLGELKQLKDDNLLSSKTWESIIKDIDLTDVSLTDLKNTQEEYGNSIPAEIFKEWKKDILESTDSFSELNQAVDDGTISREEFSKQFKEILGNDESTTEDAIISLSNSVNEGLLSQEQADDFINDILDNKCTTTEEKLAALLLYLKEMPKSAEASKKTIDELLSDPTLNMSHKADSIFAQDENGNSIYSAKTRADAAASIASKVDVSSLEHSESFINDWRAAVEEAFTAGEYAGDQYKEVLAQIAQAQQDLTEKTRDNSGLEQAVNLLKDYGIQITDAEEKTASGEGIAPEYWKEVGNALKEASENMEGLTAKEKYEVLSELLASWGLSCEDVNIKVQDLSDSVKELQIDTNLPLVDQLSDLNHQLAETGNIRGYTKAIDDMLDVEDDLTISHESLLAHLVKTGATFATAKDSVSGNTKEIDNFLKTLVKATENLDDMEVAIESLRKAGISEEKILNYENQSLINLGKSYDSCKGAAEKFENALRRGNKTAQEAAKQELNLKVNCERTADMFGLEAKEIEALAQSYQELYTQTDKNGNITQISAEMAASLAAQNINLNNGIADLKDNWWEYEASLRNVIITSEDGEETITGSAEALEKMRESVGLLINVTDSSLISTRFMQENFDLLKAAAEGAGWAVEELQVKFAKEIEAEITINDEPFHATLNEDEVYLSDWIASLPEGELGLDDTAYLQTLVNAMYEAGYTEQQIEERLNGMGISVDLTPMVEDCNTAIDVMDQTVSNMENTLADGMLVMTDSVKEASSEMIDNLGMDAKVNKETQTAEQSQAIVDVQAQTGTVTEWGHYNSPIMDENGYITGYKNIPYTMTYPTVDYQAIPDSQPATSTEEVIGFEVSNARKSSGGNISTANRQSVNPPFRARRESPRRDSGSRTPSSSSTPSTQSVRVTPASGYTRQESYRRQYHEEDYHNPVRLADWLDKIDRPERSHTELLHSPDKKKSQRSKWHDKRYEKDFEAEQKDYVTMDTSTFKNIDDEIDRYHDINRELTNIGYRLEEISQRKSRAFGKAHINAIQEEGAALKDQLRAQEEYLSQLADRRVELQEKMSEQGWEFDENGSIKNFTEKTIKDVKTFNEGQIQVNDAVNENIENFNKASLENAENATKEMRKVTDTYNETGREYTETANKGREAWDNWANESLEDLTNKTNEGFQKADEEEYSQLRALYGNFENYATQRIKEYNDTVGAEDNRYNADNRGIETNHELRWNRTNKEYERKYQSNADYYNSMTGDLGGTYDSDTAKNIQDFVDKMNTELSDRNKKADDWLKFENDENDNERDTLLSRNSELHKRTLDKEEYYFNNDMTDMLTTTKNGMADIRTAHTEAINGLKWNHEESERKINETYEEGVAYWNNYEEDARFANEEYFDVGSEKVRDQFTETQEGINKQFAEGEKITDLMAKGVEFAYEQSQKMGAEYDTLDDTMSQAMLEAQELRNKIYDNAVEVIDYTLNLNVELSNDVMAALEALLAALGDAADRAADRIAILGQKMSEFSYQVGENRNAIEGLINSTGDISKEVLKEFMNGNFSEEIFESITSKDQFTADKMALLTQYRDNLAALIVEQRALRDQMFENVMGAFNEYQDSLSLQIEKMTSLTKVTQTYQNIIGIIGKKVMDVNGELSKTLNKAAFDTQRDQTKAYKAVLNEIDSNLAGLKKQQLLFSTTTAVDEEGKNYYNPEMAAEYQKRIDEMEAKRREAEANWLSSWEAEMQAATDYYADAIDTIATVFDRSISKLIGSLESLSKEYERQQKIQEIYVEDYEKIYQLSKLTRDVQNAIDDSDHVRNKQKLKKLQEEINAANNSERKMSQYDLDVLRKKFELELARSELEESRNAKSQVRMMRDSEGNFGYVYTADANEVAKAEQNYEDKLHELQVLNTEYIKQLESNYIEMQQNVRDQIAALDISQFATQEEYLAEVERIQTAAIELQNRITEQWQGALDNNRDLYENDWQEYHNLTGYKISIDAEYLDKFKETTFAVLTDYDSLDQASKTFELSLGTACDNIRDLYAETMGYLDTALKDGGTSFDKFAGTVKTATNEVVTKSSELASGAESMAGSFEKAFGNILDGAQTFASNYVEKIQPVIDKNLELIGGINGLKEYQATHENEEGGRASGTVGSGQTWNAFATGKTGGVEIHSNIGGLLPFISTLFQFGTPENNYLGWGTGAEREKKINTAFGDTASKEINEWLSYNATGNSIGYWLSMQNDLDKYKAENFVTTDISGKVVKLDTGGYTGEWNSIEGKLAILHEKELILNQPDTENILEAVDMVRKITQTIDLNALSASSIMSDILTATSINPSNNEILQQEVHITAEFPNATERAEIIAAFDNLTNLAMQYAGKSQNFM